MSVCGRMCAPPAERLLVAETMPHHPHRYGLRQQALRAVFFWLHALVALSQCCGFRVGSVRVLAEHAFPLRVETTHARSVCIVEQSGFAPAIPKARCRG